MFFLREGFSVSLGNEVVVLAILFVQFSFYRAFAQAAFFFIAKDVLCELAQRERKNAGDFAD